MRTIDDLRLTRVINVTGTMTTIGASSVPAEVAQAMASVLPLFVDMNELQARASDVIRDVVGSEAGMVTACTASGVVIGIAATMTGADLFSVERLPDSSGLRDEVVIQKGHAIWFGASVTQLVRLAGARVVEVGDATRAERYQLEGSITERTAAALFVASHHAVRSGLIPLEEFCDVAHAKGVPVVVDAASESDMASFCERGADLVCFSGHKFLRGPTSGIVAGTRDLVAACLLHQHAGIGRPMKVGKESIVGAIAALERWQRLDHAAVRAREARLLAQARSGLEDIDGLSLHLEDDPTGNPIERLTVHVDAAAAGLSAYQCAQALREGDPRIVVRDHHARDEGFFQIDPCNTDEDEIALVIDRIRALMTLPDDRKAALRDAWPDREGCGGEARVARR